MNLRQILVSFALVLGGTSLLFGQQKTIERSYDDVTKIDLDLISGNIKIGLSDDGNVHLNGVYYPEKGEVSVTNSNGKLYIKEKSKSGYMDRPATWTLMIPNSISVRSRTASGNVEVDGVALNLHSNTGSGNFDFTNFKGFVQINTGSGNISVIDSEAEANCNTGSGNIRVSGSNGDLGLNTGSGNINLASSAGSISANSGSGQVVGKEITVTGHSSFNTGSGSVALSLAAPPSGDVRVNAGSGNSTLDMNGFKFQGELVMQCNQKNGSISAPYTFDREKVISSGQNQIVRKTKKFGSSGSKIQVSTGSGRAKVSK